jgi:hypothetical protein
MNVENQDGRRQLREVIEELVTDPDLHLPILGLEPPPKDEHVIDGYDGERAEYGHDETRGLQVFNNPAAATEDPPEHRAAAPAERRNPPAAGPSGHEHADGHSDERSEQYEP